MHGPKRAGVDNLRLVNVGFRAIPTEPLAQLAARANVVQFDRGETVFREGDDDQGCLHGHRGIVELGKGNVAAGGAWPATRYGPRPTHEHQGLTTTSNCRLLSQLG